jgi:oxygen-independent coproporphyrinogen-3 oxidase
MTARVAAGSEIERIVRAVGDVPGVVRAEAFVYPAAAPAFEDADGEERPPLSADRLRLYVHVPFCNYKCSFCHFVTRVDGSRAHRERYVAALERELLWIEPGTRLVQLFVGGGTPTALPPDLLDRLLASVFARTTPFGDDVHTVEASPESVTDAHLRVLRARGIGRVSMGVQSLDEAVLGEVHRRHGSAQVLDAVERIVGSDLILNVDLMYGLPGQTEASFRHDLETVAGRGVHSVTLYGLRVREGARVGRALRHADLPRILAWRRFVRRLAEDLGFTQVRPHTFKRPGTIADRHERVVCFDDRVQGHQFGAGTSARSLLGETVYRNRVSLDDYVARVEAGTSPVEAVFRMTEEDRRTKFVARTLGEGKVLRRDAYERAFGRSFESDHGALLERLAAGGLVEDVGEGWSLTETGLDLYDRVIVSFYPSRAIAWLRARS